MPEFKKTTNQDNVRKYLRKAIELNYPTMKAYAELEGFSVQYVSNVLAGLRPVPDWMLKRFKIKHVKSVEHWEVPV